MVIRLESVFQRSCWIDHETIVAGKIAADFNFATDSKFLGAVVP